MERNFKYFLFGFLSSVCNIIGAVALGWAINMIITLSTYSGWLVVLAFVLIIWDIFVFIFINWVLGRAVYFGSHMGSTINDKATPQEIFNAVKNNKFKWIKEELNSDETKENS